MRYAEQLNYSLSYNWHLASDCWAIMTHRRAIIILFIAFLLWGGALRMIWFGAVRDSMAMYRQDILYPNPVEGASVTFLPPAWHWVLHTVVASPQYNMTAYAITGVLVIALMRSYLAPQGSRE